MRMTTVTESKVAERNNMRKMRSARDTDTGVNGMRNPRGGEESRCEGYRTVL